MYKWLQNALSSVAGFFGKLFGSKEMAKANEVAKMVGDLLPEAIRAVEIVAQLSGSRKLEEIATVVEKYALPVKLDPSKPLTDYDVKTVLFAAAGVALRGELETAIQMAGSEGILIAGQKVKSGSDLPSNLVDLAVQSAYTFWKNCAQPAK
jgi:pyridoxal biosynthesis lyase PdxS